MTCFPHARCWRETACGWKQEEQEAKKQTIGLGVWRKRGSQEAHHRTTSFHVFLCKESVNYGYTTVNQSIACTSTWYHKSISARRRENWEIKSHKIGLSHSRRPGYLLLLPSISGKEGTPKRLLFAQLKKRSLRQRAILYIYAEHTHKGRQIRSNTS